MIYGKCDRNRSCHGRTIAGENSESGPLMIENIHTVFHVGMSILRRGQIVAILVMIL